MPGVGGTSGRKRQKPGWAPWLSSSWGTGRCQPPLGLRIIRQQGAGPVVKPEGDPGPYGRRSPIESRRSPAAPGHAGRGYRQADPPIYILHPSTTAANRRAAP